MNPNQILPSLMYWVEGSAISKPPRRYESASLDNIQGDFSNCQIALKTFAESFTDGPRAGGDLLISAPNGVGKTYIGVALTRAIAERGFRSLYVTQEHLLNQMAQGEAKDAMNIIEIVSGFDFVFIDDFGSYSPLISAEEAAYLMFRVIDARYALCKATAFATDLPLMDITKGFGISSRAFSRIDGQVISIAEEVAA